jgi:hypothetical protein
MIDLGLIEFSSIFFLQLPAQAREISIVHAVQHIAERFGCINDLDGMIVYIAQASTLFIYPSDR